MKDRLFSPVCICVNRIVHYSAWIYDRVRTGKLLRLLGWDGAQVSQITLVPDQHDDNVGVRMVPELLQPPGHIVVRLVLADIIDKEGTDSTSIVCGCDGSVSFLSSSIPNLSLDRLRVDLD